MTSDSHSMHRCFVHAPFRSASCVLSSKICGRNCAMKLPELLLVFSVLISLCIGYELPLTPAPVPDCSILTLGAEHYMLQQSLAHVVCGYAAFHNEVSRGDAPLRALIFSPGKHQLGNRVLELSSIMLLSMCTERALYLVWDSPSPISRHAQPVLFDWRISAVMHAHPDVLNQSQIMTKEDMFETSESDQPVLHYTLELGDYLLTMLQLSTCAPIINRYFQVCLISCRHLSPLSLTHAFDTELPRQPQCSFLRRPLAACSSETERRGASQDIWHLGPC